MNFVRRRRLVTLVSLIMFTCLLEICVGQPTIIDDTYTDEIDGLRAVLTNSVAQIAELKVD